METDRRVVIADAALRLIGKEGARGLTHRAVDAEAGLPTGSTSYYCRKRSDLLSLSLRRHAELDRGSLEELDAALGRVAEKVSDLARPLSRALNHWIQAQTVPELAARFELFLACSRDPELERVVQEQRAQFHEILSRRLATHSVPRPSSVATALIALIEGLLLERIRVGRVVLGPGELRTVLESLLSPAR
jgi:DNA-binding transcriptional regulator YbjK